MKEATLKDLVGSEFDRTRAEKVVMNVGAAEDRKSGAPPHVQSTPRDDALWYVGEHAGNCRHLGLADKLCRREKRMNIHAISGVTFFGLKRRARAATCSAVGSP